MEERKSIYRKLCANNSDVKLFSKDWWLDTVCGKENWDVALAYKRDKLAGALPFYFVEKYGLRYIKMPALTQNISPYIIFPEGQKKIKRIGFEEQIFEELICRLPRFQYLNMNFHHRFQNWLPFYWNNFKQTTRYTYTISDLSDLDKVWDAFDSTARNHIKKAKKKVEVIESNDWGAFYNINQKTFDRQGEEIPYSRGLFGDIIKTCQDKNAAKILFAIDNNKKIHSAVAGVYDEQAFYILAGSSNPEYRNSGAEYLLYWEMIQFASRQNLTFDFLGSMMKNVETRIRSLGGEPVPYMNISKENSKILRFYWFIKRELF